MQLVKENVSHGQRSLINSQYNRLFSNYWVKEEIKATIRGHLESGDSENMACWTLQDIAKTVFMWYIYSPKNHYFYRKNENKYIKDKL